MKSDLTPAHTAGEKAMESDGEKADYATQDPLTVDPPPPLLEMEMILTCGKRSQ